jgi:hypothetical protein
VGDLWRTMHEVSRLRWQLLCNYEVPPNAVERMNTKIPYDFRRCAVKFVVKARFEVPPFRVNALNLQGARRLAAL